MRDSNTSLVLIDILNCALNQNKYDICDSPLESELIRILRLAEKHSVLPMIFEALVPSKEEAPQNSVWYKYGSHRSERYILRQAQKTASFQLLYEHLAQQDLHPLVLKGIVCRSLYPEPEHRPSADEDLLIEPADFWRYHETMTSYGFIRVNPEQDVEDAHEVAYESKTDHLYIELHKTLFPLESSAYAELNDLFNDIRLRCSIVEIYGQKFRTLAPTDHFLFLICHAYKHFLHAGVGIRQVADMALFVNAYGKDIDWELIFSSCHKVHIETFAAALLKIAYRHLTLTSIPGPFCKIKVDEGPLLEDILSGGLYGTVDINRAHSSNMTLDAVAARKQGRRHQGILRSLFPGKAYLQTRFPYAKKNPVLVPAAWAHRILEYLCRSGRTKGNPVKTVHIGQARIELMKKYRII